MLIPLGLFALLACTHEDRCVYDHGAIIRTDTGKQEIHLVFTGDEFADGGEAIRKTLADHRIEGAFFFTGNFYRNRNFTPLVEALLDDGHYLGAHSNQHLLYASWTDRDSTLVTRKQFSDDLDANYFEMERFGITRKNAQVFLPPYEWHNDSIASWCRDSGLTLINFSPGTSSNQDWTYPSPGINYVSSDTIFARILRHEARQGLNGFILLTHIGQDPRRPDPFYLRLGDLIEELMGRGYSFTRVEKHVPCARQVP